MSKRYGRRIEDKRTYTGAHGRFTAWTQALVLTLAAVLLSTPTFAATTTRRVLVLVDNTHTEALASALATWTADVRREGFSVSIKYVSPDQSIDANKTLVRSFYNSNRSASNHLFLVGCVAVPQAWQYGPDGHGWFGAAPADSWYADMTSNWVRQTLNGESALLASGAYTLPMGRQQLSVGRVSFAPIARDETGRYDPVLEATYLQDYFAKDHAYRTGAMAIDGDALCFYQVGTWLNQALCALGFRTISVRERYAVIPATWSMEWYNATARADGNYKKPLCEKYQFIFLTPGSSSIAERGGSAAFWMRYISFTWNWQLRDALHVRKLREDPACLGTYWSWKTDCMGDFLNRRCTWGEALRLTENVPALTPLGDPTLKIHP